MSRGRAHYHHALCFCLDVFISKMYLFELIDYLDKAHCQGRKIRGQTRVTILIRLARMIITTKVTRFSDYNDHFYY